jgi:hypothetical protein
MWYMSESAWCEACNSTGLVYWFGLRQTVQGLSVVFALANKPVPVIV